MGKLLMFLIMDHGSFDLPCVFSYIRTWTERENTVNCNGEAQANSGWLDLIYFLFSHPGG